ncbi:MAG TPA: hypothetical protein VKE40_11905 [Gemmataceae bacterium]|nr:hypothetical protein [Gemmataceae bacterium]
MNPQLSPMAQALLRGHQPNVPAYLSCEALGGTFREGDLKRIDDAYEELVRAGLMERTSATLTVLPRIVRNSFRLTADGRSLHESLR